MDGPFSSGVIVLERPFVQPQMSSNQDRFATVPGVGIPRSVFDRTHFHKTAVAAGFLYPIIAEEVLPGDSVSLKVTTFARFQPTVVPVMDNVYADIHFFFVPNRLLWTNWEKFNGAQDDPGDSTDFLFPVVDTPAGATFYASGSLADYFGIPVGVDVVNVRADFFRAYNLIWNEWYRDQNQQDSLNVPVDDGPDAATTYVLKRRNKRHDYFTSALPWAQKGDPVSLPLGTTAPVVADGNFSLRENTGLTVRQIGFHNTGVINYTGAAVTSADSLYASGLEVDLSGATAATINSIREAFQFQRLLERDARGGTRYVEFLRSHFGVVSPDFRLQRPEFLGQATTKLTQTPVPQTSESGTTPQGNLTGIAAFSHTAGGVSKSFVEHGVLIGLLSIRADLNYQQGLDRKWVRSTRYDFYLPVLAHLGEQAILTQEIYCTGTATDDDVFGYQERWAEYRYSRNQITGVMRSQVAASLDVYHLAQEFSAAPVLGDTFIQENPPISRVVAVTDEPPFLVDCLFNAKWARPMPTYSVPGLTDSL